MAKRKISMIRKQKEQLRIIHFTTTNLDTYTTALLMALSITLNIIIRLEVEIQLENFGLKHLQQLIQTHHIHLAS
uniref:Uncharacterized protein n=1 Tax=Arundo donax TaxID=35708 RepID=A0A0A9FSV4_ARUDO